jgi:sugar phosphate isomerase/epimerase
MRIDQRHSFRHAAERSQAICIPIPLAAATHSRLRMLPCLAQVCTLSAPFEQDIADYAAGQCKAIELWLGKLETYLESHTLDDVKRLLDEHEVAAPVASFQGGLLTSQGDARRLAWEHFDKRLALCRDLTVRTIVVAGDLIQPLNQRDFGRLMLSLEQAAERATTYGVRVALEFQATATLPNNLQTAASLVAEVNHPLLGLCLDAFHYHTGPSKPEDLNHLTAENLFHVQLCDLAGTAREMATDSDRVLPGDGDIVLAPIIARLREINYAAYVSVELMNPQIWQVSPRSFGEVAMTALRKTLGLASMD